MFISFLIFLELSVPQKQRLRYQQTMSSQIRSSWAPGCQPADARAHFGESFSPPCRYKIKKTTNNNNIRNLRLSNKKLQGQSSSMYQYCSNASDVLHSEAPSLQQLSLHESFPISQHSNNRVIIVK